MKKIEIKNIGVFEIKHNYLHRGINPRIITFDNHKYKILQFNSYEEYSNCIDPSYNPFQLGYAMDGSEIFLRILKNN